MDFASRGYACAAQKQLCNGMEGGGGGPPASLQALLQRRIGDYPKAKTSQRRIRGERRHLPPSQQAIRQTHPSLSPHLSAIRSGHAAVLHLSHLRSSSRKNWIFSYIKWDVISRCAQSREKVNSVVSPAVRVVNQSSETRPRSPR